MLRNGRGQALTPPLAWVMFRHGRRRLGGAGTVHLRCKHHRRFGMQFVQYRANINCCLRLHADGMNEDHARPTNATTSLHLS